MATFCNRALETRVEGIAAEDGEEVGERLVLGRGAVVVYEGLEAGDAADGLGGTCSWGGGGNISVGCGLRGWGKYSMW